jgi:hypothetical protein
VVGDDGRTALRSELLLPLAPGRVEALEERREPVAVGFGVAGIDLGEPGGDALRDLRCRARVAQVMRVAAGVDVAHAAVHRPDRHVEHVDELRAIEVAAAPRLDVRVARAGEEYREPPDLEVETDEEQQIGAVQLEREARLRVDEVRILRRERERADVHRLAADVLRDRGEIGDGRDDAERRGRVGRRERERDGGEAGQA